MRFADRSACCSECEGLGGGVVKGKECSCDGSVGILGGGGVYRTFVCDCQQRASVIRSRRKNREEEEDILAAVKVVKMVSEQSSFTPVSCHAGGREVEGVVARLRVSCKLRCRFLV